MTLSKLAHRLSRSSILFSIVLLYNSCGPKIIPPPSTRTMTITFSGVLGNCHNPLSSSAPIPYKGYVLVYYFDATGRNPQQGDYQTFVSGTNPATPVSVTVHVPAQTYYKFDIVVEGTVCSTCAPTQVGGWTCIQQPNSGNTGITAALPKYEKQTGIWTSYEPTWTIGSTDWMHLADPNSCGCVVPN